MPPAAVALAFALVGPPASVDVLFPTADGFARLRVTVSADGESPEREWRAFLDHLFAHFDRDGDGTLSRAEAERVPPLPAPGGEVKPDPARMTTPAEFRSFYRTAGFAPVVATVQPPSARSRALSDALFAALDRDGDRTLSAKELTAAPDLLRRLDDNEDDELSEAELLPTPPKDEPGQSALRVEAPDGTPDARLNAALGLTPASLDPNEVVPLTARFPPTLSRYSQTLPQSWADPFAVPGGSLLLAPDLIDDSAKPRPLAARELVLEQFATAGGRADKPVAKGSVDGVRTLRLLAGVFDPADRDGDGKLTAAELAAFVELAEALARCRVFLTVQDEGKSVFDLFNTGGGATLTRTELEKAATWLVTTADTLPRTTRMSYGRRPTGGAFAGLPLANPPAAEKPKAKPPTTGPRWFRAMDANADGAVTAGEFAGRPERFKELDKDGDGRISPAEADAAK